MTESTNPPSPETAETPEDDVPRVNFFNEETARCPQPAYADARERCPVARSVLGDGAVISRFEDVMWALRHPEIFSSAMDMQLALGTERPMIPQQIDPPEQTRYRKLLDPCFSRKRMSLLIPSIRSEANQLIDRFIDEGECEFDSAFAIPLPCYAFLDLMGLPRADLDLFLELKNGIIRPQTLIPEGTDPAEKRAETGKRIYAYFDEAIKERRKKPTEDLLGYLVESEIKGEKLTHEETLDICFLFLLGGLDTVTATLGCNIAYLAENPEQRQQLVDHPDRIEGAIEELLRWETPVTALPRVLKEDVTLHGHTMKKGELVTLLIGAANTDDEAFPDAQKVDFQRESNRHIAFGAGAHRCLGSHLARMELGAAMEEWHRRIPNYKIKPGEVPSYSPGIREVLYLPLVWET